jgi:ADP-L-glycero-D-manno-heptose 6-epimerase
VKILVTGNYGFIGQNMVKALAGHEVSMYEWDANFFPKVQGHDWVIHLGAISSTTERDVEKVMLQNYDFSCELFDKCAAYGVNLQYSSSASVYGQNLQFAETDPVSPLSPYAWSKYLFDRYVKDRTPSNIRVQGFRYFNVFGPHEDHKGTQASPYHQFTKQAQATGVIKLFTNSDKFFRDFVPVETVVDMHLQFFDVNESGLWNIGTGEAKSFQTVAEEVAAKYNARIEYVPMPDNIKNQYQYYTKANINKLHNTLYDKDRSQRHV